MPLKQLPCSGFQPGDRDALFIPSTQHERRHKRADGTHVYFCLLVLFPRSTHLSDEGVRRGAFDGSPRESASAKRASCAHRCVFLKRLSYQRQLPFTSAPLTLRPIRNYCIRFRDLFQAATSGRRGPRHQPYAGPVQSPDRHPAPGVC